MGTARPIFWPPLVSPDITLPLNAQALGGGRFMGYRSYPLIKVQASFKMMPAVALFGSSWTQGSDDSVETRQSLAQVGPKGPTTTAEQD